MENNSSLTRMLKELLKKKLQFLEIAENKLLAYKVTWNQIGITPDSPLKG